jgi:hypothetical protein
MPSQWYTFSKEAQSLCLSSIDIFDVDLLGLAENTGTSVKELRAKRAEVMRDVWDNMTRKAQDQMVEELCLMVEERMVPKCDSNGVNDRSFVS